MSNVGWEVIPTLGDGDARGVVDGLLGLPTLGVCCGPWFSLGWYREKRKIGKDRKVRTEAGNEFAISVALEVCIYSHAEGEVINASILVRPTSGGRRSVALGIRKVAPGIMESWRKWSYGDWRPWSLVWKHDSEWISWSDARFSFVKRKYNVTIIYMNFGTKSFILKLGGMCWRWNFAELFIEGNRPIEPPEEPVESKLSWDHGQRWRGIGQKRTRSRSNGWSLNRTRRRC